VHSGISNTASGFQRTDPVYQNFIVHSGISNTASGFQKTDPMYQNLKGRVWCRKRVPVSE
jgi:hypothetical protein